MTKWPTKKLDEVAHVIMGQSPPSSTYNENGKGLPFFQGKAEFGETYPVPVKYCSVPIRIVETSDVLVCVRAPVGIVNIAKEKSCIGRGLAAVRTDNKILNQRFLYYFLKLNENNWSSLSTGSTFVAIKRLHLENLKIPLPTLKIQHQIVERLDAIKKAQVLNDKQIALADELFQSLLEKELDSRGKGWEVKRLGEVTVFKRGPFGGSLKKEIFVEHGYKVYEQKNAIYNDFVLGNYFISEEKYREMIDFAIHPGDLIVSCSGTIGKVAKVPADAQLGIINQALLKITPLEDTITSDYLKFILETLSIQRQLTINSRGAAIQNVASVKETKRIKLHLPPLQTQRQIVEKLQAAHDYKKKLLEQKQKLKELFDSCLDKAMKGG